MAPPRFLSVFRQPLSHTRPLAGGPSSSRLLAVLTRLPREHHGMLPWIACPLDKSQRLPQLYHHPDATPIELFFDLFFVANLSTFTATHEINNVTLFDVRFARDSFFERVCKAIQLGAMVGFASAGSRFTTRVRDENVWAFQSLSLILAGSRILLAVQYTVNVAFIHPYMKPAARGVAYTALVFWMTTIFYLGMYFAFSRGNGLRPQIWTVWFVMFGFEMWTVLGVSWLFPEIGFQDTHLNIRMGLLTLIIIGEGVIAVTRIVNKTVRPGGWTKWSFVHILGVTTNVYLLWQVYFDVSPWHRYGRLKQQIWVQLHFPFHVALILLLEGSQILALTLDVTLKLRYLEETLLFVCEEPRPSTAIAVELIRSTISDMEIPFSRGATQEWTAISSLLEDLSLQPLCPDITVLGYAFTEDLFSDLMGNVTAALFSSMDITPSKKVNISFLSSQQLLQMYMKLLAFVYIYFFVVASISMCIFAAFLVLSRRHKSRLYLGLSMTMRILLAVSLASLVSFSSHFPLAYTFMTSPVILYAFTFTLLAGQFLIATFEDSETDWCQCSWLTDFWTLWHPDEMQLTDGHGKLKPSFSVPQLRWGWRVWIQMPLWRLSLIIVSDLMSGNLSMFSLPLANYGILQVYCMISADSL
ncbi:hypothetical protein N7462_011459 [Penicillium macrosclerotiorum]|uniref:uncharacterized protein n=1 Tax=Penicillium macrosclerotiorum TaxID=303699 RepID=UPI0025499B38|nr:uncharacterized protein N7462_011459 [Penicillium macrosclerotiorum]KAJ5664646.1 hypothetical protein N7462_011459 [Penicillium macrosclerotiorum]